MILTARINHKLLFATVFLLLGLIINLIFAQRAFAFENPHRYYDWNTYYPPSEQVLGIEAFAQEATPSAGPGQATDSAGATGSAVPTTPTSPPPSDYHDYREFGGYVLGFTSNFAPDNPFYFVKRAQENIAITFTFDPKVREETRLELAGERLSEMEAMAEKGRADLVTSLATEYNNTVGAVTDNLKNLKDQNQDVTSVLVATDVEGAKHTLVLEEVSFQVPPQAEQGIQTAIAASEKAVDTVADLAGRPAVPPELIARLQSLRAQGLLTEEEVATLVSVNSRVQARGEFRKLADARVLPEADFKKLDEAARSYFPQGYANVIEYKKFRELKDLETQRPDDATLKQVQDFADKYKPGNPVPSELRRWWVPMVRLEELQNTIRPDLIREDFFRYRPEDQQKYRELVERLKPRPEDLAYVNKVLSDNPALLSDPAYARIKALADTFGTEVREEGLRPTQTCSRDSHWVSIPFMPNGGYCVPNFVYRLVGDVIETTCPPGYHRNDPFGACYPDNPYGPGAGTTGGGILPAPGSCFSGYHWVPEPTSPRGGYCSPDYPTGGGGPFPGPFTPPTYCPSNQVFRDGKCETYNPPPPGGCPQGEWWNGQKCVAPKNCGAGFYQDSNGECKSSTDQYRYYETQCTGRPIPPAGCGAGYWDMATCSCRYGYATPSGGDGTYPYPPGSCPAGSNWVPEPSNRQGGYCAATGPGGPGGSCTEPPAGCGSTMTWDRGTCTCKPLSCPPDTAWNGTYCMPNTGGSGSPSREAQEAACRAGGGTCTGWYNNACSCEYPNRTGGYPTPSYSGVCQPPPSGCTGGWYDYASCSCRTTTYLSPSGSYGTPSGSGSCGPGYYWTGTYCAITSGPYGSPYSYPTPGTSYGYPTPYYGTPSGSYTTPPYYTPSDSSYTTPSYPSPSYLSPYGSPGYGTPSDSYTTPSYGSPSYGTPDYPTPAYGTPTYGTPYGTPAGSYGTPVTP